MKRPFTRRELAGVGAAACVACCAVPIAAFLASIGVLTAGAVLTFGVLGLVVLLPAAAWRHRRRIGA